MYYLMVFDSASHFPPFAAGYMKFYQEYSPRNNSRKIFNKLLIFIFKYAIFYTGFQMGQGETRGGVTQRPKALLRYNTQQRSDAEVCTGSCSPQDTHLCVASLCLKTNSQKQFLRPSHFKTVFPCKINLVFPANIIYNKEKTELLDRKGKLYGKHRRKYS